MDSSFKENTCVVCFHNISIYAVGDCDHYDRICYICSTRLRVLCNKYECPICRKDIPKVIFSKHKQPYGALSKIQYPMDYKYKIAFADDQVRGDYETLLEHPCHKCPEKRVFRSFGHLKDHVRKEHELFFCELCVDNLKLFTHERRCYTRRELGTHRRVGDTDDTSHRGHPHCQFCEERYMDKDELFRHLRKEHYYCHFCDENGLYQFYGDYRFLRDHFRDEHFLCEEGDCKEEQFTGVFRSQIDLKAHKATKHCKNMNKLQAKQARTLELEFTIRPRPQQHQNAESYDAGARRGRKGAGGSRPPRDQPQQQQVRSRENDPEEDGLFTFFSSSDPAPDTKCQKQFPQLGDSHDQPDGKVTVSATIPRAYGRNYNRQSEDDFPTLSGVPNTARNNVSSARVTVSQPLIPTANSVLFKINNNDKSGGGGNISIQVSSKAKAKPAMSKEDFPSLSTHLKTTNVPTPQPEQKKQQPVIANKSKSAQEVNGWNSSNPSPGNFEADFPNLAGNANGTQQMGRSTLTIPVGGSTWSKSNSGKANNSVDNKKKPEPESAFTVIKNKAKKSAKNVQVETAPKNKENNSKKKEEVKKVEANKNSEEFSSFKNNYDSDILTKKNSSPNNNETSSIQSQKVEKIPLKPKICADEFPPLVSENKLPVPPGFSSKTNENSKNPPPGFHSGAQNSLNKTITALTLSSVAKQLLNPSPPPLSLDSITAIPNIAKAAYIEPDNFNDRNRLLITKIRDILDGDEVAFSDFKQLSGQFRQSMVQAREYYDRCISIFGKEKFLKVLPELLVLLPDISKEQELLIVFNQMCKREGKSSGAVPKASVTTNVQNSLQLLVCATCQQVLTARDFQKHMLAHNEDALFPPLGGNADVTATHNSWVKK